MSPKKLTLELPTGLHRIQSRGKTYWYWRPNRKAAQLGKEKLISIRLPGSPNESEFWEKLETIGALSSTRYLTQSEIKPGTFAALIRDYQNDIAFYQLSVETQRQYKRYHAILLDIWANVQVYKIKPKHVLALRNEYRDTPYKANYLLRCLSSLLSWGIPMDYLSSNPCQNVRQLKTTGEYEPWSWDQIEFFKRHAQPHIWHVIAMCVYTGQRITDVLQMRWTDISNSGICVKQNKTKKLLQIPIHPDLQEVLYQHSLNETHLMSSQISANMIQDYKQNGEVCHGESDFYFIKIYSR